MSTQFLSTTIKQIVDTAGLQLNAIGDLTYLEAKSNPQKWSKKEILGHLVDSAYNNHRRFKVAADQEHLVFDGYDQDREVVQHQYQQRDYHEILSGWKSANTQIAYLIASLSDELLNRQTIQHNFDRIAFKQVAKGQSAALKYLVKDYIIHLEYHLAQIIGDAYIKVLKHT